MLRHPEVYDRSCSDCKLWVYGQDGRIETRAGKPVARTGPPPCWSCPKKSPQEAHKYELTRENQALYNLYLQVRASGGACLSEEQRASRRLMEKLSAIDSIVESDRRQKLASELATVLGAAGG